MAANEQKPLKEAFLREKDVLERIPISRSTLWKMVRENRFPKPVKLSSRVTVWRESGVNAFIENPKQL